MTLKKWNENKLGRITLEKIRDLFESDNCVVRWNKYESGAEFNGWSKAQTKYILSGSCEIIIAGKEYSLQIGDYIDLPEGKYCFKVTGEGVIEVASLFKLSDSLSK